MDDVIYLISQSFKKDVLGQLIPCDEKRIEVLVEVLSISRAEFFSAGKNGLTPELVFKTSAINYSGEKIIEFGGKRYAVYRTFNIPGSDDIEIYVKKETGVL